MANFDYRKAVKENKATFHTSLNEGQFSWMTQDTEQQIGSEKENTIPVYMFDNKGKYYYEKEYSGYGEFGGKDYYDLVAEMNGYTKDDAYELGGTFKELRGIGIKLAFGELEPKNGGPVLFPALVAEPNTFNYKTHDFTQEAENDPDQSWYTPEEEEDDDDYGYSWEDQYGDDEEYDDEEELEEGTTNKMKVSEFKAKIKEMILSEMNPKDEPDEMESGAWDMAMRESEKINETNNPRVWKMFDLIRDNMDDSQFLQELISAMDTDEAIANLGHIIQMYDLEDYSSLREAEDEEEVTDTEEVDVDVEEPTPSDDGGISVSQNADADLTGVEKEVQDNLEAAMEAAKKLGDEKLQKQIGNSLTFFTRQHVVKEDLNESVFPMLKKILK
jgi:hypothetical protein